MASPVLLPRLDARVASRLRSHLVRGEVGVKFDPTAMERALGDARAFPATGGARISEAELLDLRAGCVAASESACESESAFGAAFDLFVGRELFTRTAGRRGEAGVPGVWDFLTLILLPDLARSRITAGAAGLKDTAESRKRVTGGDRRHVFQRLWRRWAVFGSELVEGRQLTEDDYVAMLERRLTLERPAVARRAARTIIASELYGGARREYTRKLMRNLVQMSGLVHIGEDDPSHLDAVFRQLDDDTRGVLQVTSDTA